MRNSFHYAAVHLGSMANSARDVDFAMRWGFGVKQGPFELWQQAGWKQVAQWVKEDIDAGKALSKAPLPDWVFDGREGVHTAEGSWNPTQKQYQPLSALPVYQRQYLPRERRRRQRAGPGHRRQDACTRTPRCACGRWTTRC